MLKSGYLYHFPLDGRTHSNTLAWHEFSDPGSKGGPLQSVALGLRATQECHHAVCRNGVRAAHQDQIRARDVPKRKRSSITRNNGLRAPPGVRTLEAGTATRLDLHATHVRNPQPVHPLRQRPPRPPLTPMALLRRVHPIIRGLDRNRHRTLPREGEPPPPRPPLASRGKLRPDPPRRRCEVVL